VTAEEDIASVAGQLADLARTVARMERQLKAISEWERLQAAANALRESI
jgi:hypothetical protein